ncbi:hypothetical protein CERSUDRAFT_80794 [Gelatoporia subvermispora B]|uniref:C2H2-type domain-containing protein n=1 Tax=Ceriporiopsis subvermispora (strain B) TaxID=914234 RepID=M2RRW1_CERS8|nr:hypothetical protein CERSUDRAFT_80794 [Gelatoporia subvermispora B]
MAGRSHARDHTRASHYRQRHGSNAGVKSEHLPVTLTASQNEGANAQHSPRVPRHGSDRSSAYIAHTPESVPQSPVASRVRATSGCTCPACCDPRRSPSAYTTHPYVPSPHENARRKIENEKKHACNWCGKRFDRPSSLAIHVNTHTGEKPYVCEFPGCGRKFNVNSNMRRHYRNHCSSPSNRLPALPPLRDVIPTSPISPFHYTGYPSTPRPTPENSPYSADSNSCLYYGDSDSDEYSDYGISEDGHQRYEPMVMEATSSLANMKFATHRDAIHTSPRVISHTDLRGRSYSDSRASHATENRRGVP